MRDSSIQHAKKTDKSQSVLANRVSMSHSEAYGAVKSGLNNHLLEVLQAAVAIRIMVETSTRLKLHKATDPKTQLANCVPSLQSFFQSSLHTAAAEHAYTVVF